MARMPPIPKAYPPPDEHGNWKHPVPMRYPDELALRQLHDQMPDGYTLVALRSRAVRLGIGEIARNTSKEGE